MSVVRTKKNLQKRAGLIILLVQLWATPHFLPAQEVNPNGYNIFRFPNGAISSEGHLNNGKPEGYWKSYFPDGQLKSEGIWLNNQLDSIWRFFAQNSDTLEQISYRKGKKNGYTLKYYRSDSLGQQNTVKSKTLFVNDKEQGTAWTYYPDGQIHVILKYEEGLKNGRAYEFDSQGTIITELRYRNDALYDKILVNRRDSKGQKQGLWRTYSADYKIVTEEYYVNGKLDGIRKIYDSYGKLLKSEEYKAGKALAQEEIDKKTAKIEETFYNDGQLKSAGAYQDSKPVGIHREFDTTGTVVNAAVFDTEGIKTGEGIVDIEGRKQGKWTELYPNGDKQAMGTYNDDKRVGPWRFYYPGGKREQEGQYVDGKPNARWTWYYPDGSIMREEEYYRGREDGIALEYSQNGDTIVSGRYIDGFRDGEWSLKIGTVLQKGVYKAGRRDGLWQYFYENGKLKFEGEFVLGDPNGWHKYYYQGGLLKEEQYYNMGRRDKTWRKYDETGMTEIAITYENDKEIKVDGLKVK